MSIGLTLALTVAFVVYGNWIASTSFSEGTKSRFNLTVGFLSVVVVQATDHLSWREIGFASNNLPRGLLVGLLAALAIVLTIAVAAERTNWFSDDRYRHIPRNRLPARIVRIFVATALVEEIIFRGLLIALWTELAGSIWAAVTSSLAFGLWHIRAEQLRTDTSRGSYTKVVAGVGALCCVGLGFVALRHLGQGLVAPVIVHGAANSAATVATVLSTLGPSDSTSGSL
jgi:membrane protease YdiL (CAAX protease family)